MRNDKGFSLMEVLIALAITATLASAGTFMMVQTLNASSAIDLRMEDVRGQIKSDNLIRNDLSSVTSRIGVAQDQAPSAHGFVGGQSKDNAILMSFIRDDWTEAATIRTRSNLQRVEYHLMEDKLVRRAWVRPDPSRQTPYTERVLYTDLEDINLRYRENGKWLDVWPATYDGKHPDLIEITVIFSQNDTLTLNYAVGLPS